MKKLLIVLAVLLVAGAGAFADVTVSGTVREALTANSTGGVFTATESQQGSNEEVVITGNVDDNTMAVIKLQLNGNVPSIDLDEIYVSSNVFGALGLDLPISLNFTTGRYEHYYNNWNYVSRSGKEYYYPGASWSGDAGASWLFIGAANPSNDMAWTWKFGFGDFALTYYNTLNFGNMLAAFSGNVSILNFVVGFAGDFAALQNGTLFVEAGANIDLGAATLFIPAKFAYNFAGAWDWSSGVKAGIMDAVTVSVGVGGSNSNPFRYILPEVSTQAIKGLDIYAIAEIDLADTAAFNSVDIGAAYQLGGMEVNPGVVIALDDTLFTSIANDGYWFQGTGFYIDFTVSY